MTIQTRTLSYTDSQGVTLKSHLCLPKQAVDGLSGVLVAPEWWGLSEHAKRSAERLAEAGYAALAIDLYGDALLTDKADVANQNMTYLLEHPEILNERTDLALAQLQNLPEVAKMNVGAIGFCFGGKVVLDMARRGLPLKAVTSFHGILTPAAPALEGMVKGEILVQHGEADTLTTMDDVAAFRKEMDDAKVVYHIDVFPGVKHGFTNPQATENGEKNHVDFLDYNAEAAETSWRNMLGFLERHL
ncbi:dienelactone hydrolase family protein [Neisseria wadsworthii]|uniref:dienelactone hydrolase family protein n=1 Tax=Neisseria wadsworthii TaxID=607711 RepID=UPI000D31FC77|nr:dienelactone hydrolase family protein [Neisseria wadsworthii]